MMSIIIQSIVQFSWFFFLWFFLGFSSSDFFSLFWIPSLSCPIHHELFLFIILFILNFKRVQFNWLVIMSILDHLIYNIILFVTFLPLILDLVMSIQTFYYFVNDSMMQFSSKHSDPIVQFCILQMSLSLLTYLWPHKSFE